MNLLLSSVTTSLNRGVIRRELSLNHIIFLSFGLALDGLHFPLLSARLVSVRLLVEGDHATTR